MDKDKASNDSRVKFLDALEKKRQKGAGGSNGGPGARSKVGGGQATGGAPKRFQRKSGSA